MQASSLPIIIQCSQKSLSYKAKHLEPLGDNQTVLGFLVNRLQHFGSGSILIAISCESEDDILADLATSLSVPYYRGDQDNLISRLKTASETLDCRHFVRVLGNHPLIDLEAMTILAQEHISRNAEFSYNNHRKGIPWGMGCEVISTCALDKLLAAELSNEEKESFSPFIRQNYHEFQTFSQDSDYARPNLKLAIENKRDLNLARHLVSHVSVISTPPIVSYLDEHPIIAQSNIPLPTNEVGLEKLFLHPRKARSLFAVNQKVDITYPISVELSLTNRCNLQCVWCSDYPLRLRQGISQELDLKSIQALFDDLKAGGCQGIVIEGGGEPTLHPEFPAIIEALRERELAAGLITNGTIDIPSELAETFEWVRVSLDASTPKEYKHFKGKDFFRQTFTNIKSLAKNCPTVGIGYIITNQNTSMLEETVIRIRDIGCAYIQFRPIIDYPDLLPKEINFEHLKSYEKDNFAVIINSMTDNVIQGNAGIGCKAHSLTSVISADGSVFLCGRLNFHNWFKSIGNIRRHPFRTIWNGEERKRQCSMVSKGHFCLRYCPVCRLTKFNQMVHRIQKIKTPNFI